MEKRKIVEKFGQDILHIKERATERSFYRSLCSFLEVIMQDKYSNISTMVEESSFVDNREIGYPDITVRQSNRLVGWVEVKLPEGDLNDKKYFKQFNRYKESLENIIFTNLIEWQIWQWDEEGKSHKVSEITFNPADFKVGQETKYFDFLEKFFEGRPYEARTPKQLALALAKKTRLLSHQVEEAYDETDSDSDLVKLRDTFEKTLIQDIKVHQFANMVAETIAYSLFLAALEHLRHDNNEELTLTTALDYLPTNVPILSDLYQLVTKVSKGMPLINQAAHILVDQLNAADIRKVYNKLVEHKLGADPVIQFYEPFLKEYDPKERVARGVYYTPKPIVDYIVRSVDYILREKFNKTKGLADESVYLLDPAAGTGTFLMSSIQQVYSVIENENKTLGEDIVKKEFQQIVVNHILKHFYGFELLIAPYAVSHLKLTLLLEELGFNFEMTKNDSDEDNDRMKIYLANTLDDPRPKEKQGTYDALGRIAFPSIPRESEAARKIKKDVPILAIIGNPPYSNFGKMNKGEWILNLIKDYKKNMNERKVNLDDDFIKFIRFAQWKLEETGQGIFAMITNNAFIDGITHRQMRKSILDTFDEIYIYNLHGSSRKKEACPDGSRDENVFNIQQGVSINIFIKYPKVNTNKIVRSCDLWGTKEYKYEVLLEQTFNDTRWEAISPKEPYWFFVKKDENIEKEYKSYLEFNKCFNDNSVGVGTKVDSLAIDNNPDILGERIKTILRNKPTLDELMQQYNLSPDTTWEYDRAKESVYDKNKIIPYDYRPFDRRFIYYDVNFISRARYKIMSNFLCHKNLGIELSKTNDLSNFTNVFVSKLISDEHFGGAKSYKYPLYIYRDDGQETLIDLDQRTPNLSNQFIGQCEQKLGLKFRQNNSSLKDTFSPEDIFYYTYAIFHSQTYRSRYAEQLKINFPRLPLTREKELFRRLVIKGNELVNLHLFGENPFDKTKTIFDDKTKWGIKTGTLMQDSIDSWEIGDIRFDSGSERVYINSKQYFEGVEKKSWEFYIGGYKVCEKWLKDRKKIGGYLSKDDLVYYMKIVVAIRETVRLMKEIDEIIETYGKFPKAFA